MPLWHETSILDSQVIIKGFRSIFSPLRPPKRPLRAQAVCRYRGLASALTRARTRGTIIQHRGELKNHFTGRLRMRKPDLRSSLTKPRGQVRRHLPEGRRRRFHSVSFHDLLGLLFPTRFCFFGGSGACQDLFHHSPLGCGHSHNIQTI
jgi:hypothetical protein